MSSRATWNSPRSRSGDMPDGKASAYNPLTAASFHCAYHWGNLRRISAKGGLATLFNSRCNVSSLLPR
eukprot:7238074-Alexandrium_andersonii.AAC.1